MSTFHAVYEDERCLEPVAIVAEPYLGELQWIMWVMHAQLFATAVLNFDYNLN